MSVLERERTTLGACDRERRSGTMCLAYQRRLCMAKVMEDLDVTHTVIIAHRKQASEIICTGHNGFGPHNLLQYSICKI
jgi:hypothetical protein